MSEEEYFTQHHNDNTDLLLLDYSERFETLTSTSKTPASH